MACHDNVCEFMEREEMQRVIRELRTQNLMQDRQIESLQADKDNYLGKSRRPRGPDPVNRS